MALGWAVFCHPGTTAAAEQQAGDSHAAADASSDGASRTAAASASDSAPSDTTAAHSSDPKASDATSSDASAPVCFKLTSHCIDSSSANGKTGKARPLNLNAPDVRSVVPVQELKEPLPTPEEQNTAEETNTVQVAGDSNTPDVPGGFGALWWAIRNPAQAWRIFAPVQ
ncbi:MAG: hypothetical protein JOY91_10820 [Sinobacteraceae bacterium]|nr:hypothetical protein [Nevskiaceae bacterium]